MKKAKHSFQRQSVFCFTPGLDLSKEGRNSMLRTFAFKRHIIVLGVCVFLVGIMIPLASFAKSASIRGHQAPFQSRTISAPSVTANTAGHSLFGDAKIVKPGNHSKHAVQLNSAPTPAPGYGGIDFKVPVGLTFSGITNLSTDYNFTHNSCAVGSPRFQINILGKNAFVYIGPPPNYTGCSMNVWVNTGNLATPASFVDTSQLPGGTFYDTFTSADVKYGTATVTGIQLVADGGYAFTDMQQTVLIDNVMINKKTYGFEPKKEDPGK